MKVQLRSDTASNWTTNNPTLDKGEFGVEWDTGKFKIGNGVDNWTTLGYGGGAGGGGSGTVTSVALTTPAWLNIAGSPITGSGTLAISAKTGQTANLFLATPDGATGAVVLRSIVAGDIPILNQSTTGNAATATKLVTARNIAGVPFDGSANISIPFANLTSKPTTKAGYGIADVPAISGATTIAVVSSLPGTPDANTIYLVTS